jgi:lipid-binding SYLF domain-containing protein
MKGGRVTDYFNTVSASWGWQIGAESYAYVVYLMSDKAVKYLEESQGWEFGVGPNVVIVDEGMAKNLSTTSLRDDAYAFVTDQEGLMASLSFEGTKISRIKR